jgi:preprotein translocase subunit YajC
MFAAMIGIFYFMVMRPQQKRVKEHQALLGSVKRGDKVVLNNGMHGTIHEVEDKTVLVEIARNTVVKFDKAAIQSVVAA